MSSFRWSRPSRTTFAIIHIPYFLKATSAPRQDRDLWLDLLMYKGCFEEGNVQCQMVTAIQDNFRSHLWYLTEELVIFGLFDIHIPIEERRAMALKLSGSRKPPQFLPGKPKFHPHLLTENVQLDSFVKPKSWLMFEKLGANGQWLTSDPETWGEEY